jgi:hypothetical protein
MSHMFRVFGRAIESSLRVINGFMSCAALNWLLGVGEDGQIIDADEFL